MDVYVMTERSSDYGNSDRDRKVKFIWYIAVPVDLPGKPFAIKELATAEVDPTDVHGAHTSQKLTDGEAEDWVANHDITLRMNVYSRTYRLQEVLHARLATDAERNKIIDILTQSRDFNTKLANDAQEVISVIATPNSSAIQEMEGK